MLDFSAQQRVSLSRSPEQQKSERNTKSKASLFSKASRLDNVDMDIVYQNVATKLKEKYSQSNVCLSIPMHEAKYMDRG